MIGKIENNAIRAGLEKLTKTDTEIQREIEEINFDIKAIEAVLSERKFIGLGFSYKAIKTSSVSKGVELHTLYQIAWDLWKGKPRLVVSKSRWNLYEDGADDWITEDSYLKPMIECPFTDRIKMHDYIPDFLEALNEHADFEIFQAKRKETGRGIRLLLESAIKQNVPPEVAKYVK